MKNNDSFDALFTIMQNLFEKINDYLKSYTIKDNAGNSTVCSKEVNVYVDKTKPTCTDDGDSTTWTKNNRKITYGCDDQESGCSPSYNGGEEEFTSTTQTATINYQRYPNLTKALYAYRIKQL